MNKDHFFEAVKNGVLENLKKTDETLETTIYDAVSTSGIIRTSRTPFCVFGASI